MKTIEEIRKVRNNYYPQGMEAAMFDKITDEELVKELKYCNGRSVITNLCWFTEIMHVFEEFQFDICDDAYHLGDAANVDNFFTIPKDAVKKIVKFRDSIKDEYVGNDAMIIICLKDGYSIRIVHMG